MSFQFRLFQKIKTADDHIMRFYKLGAIKWIDKNYNNAWSTAWSRFDRACVEALKTKDDRFLDAEREIYISTLMGLLRLYKGKDADKEVQGFFEGLKNETDNEFETIII